MSWVIYKYEVKFREYFEIMLPQGAEVLTCQVQRGTPVIWVASDPKAPLKRRAFKLGVTGGTIFKKDAWGYIGTFQMAEGNLVYHLFEVPVREDV